MMQSHGKRHMTRSGTRIFGGLALAVATLLGIHGTALAQNALGDGRALENNLQVGSGGYNNPAPARDPNLGNNIITGNVSGLGYFHGNAGYRAPGELQINLPSESLFRFQSRSLNPAMLPGQNWRPAGGGPVSVYRGYATPTGAGYDQGSATRQVVPAGGVQVSVPRQPQQGFETTSPDRTLGVAVQPDGRILELRASPLLGLRVESGGQPAPAPVSTPDTSLRVEPIRAMSGIGAAYGPAGLPDTAGADQRTAANSLVDAGLPRRADVPPSAASGPSLTLEQRVRQLQAAVFNPEGSVTAQPGQDVYLDMLNKMREARTAAAGRFPAEAPAPGGRTTQVVPPTPDAPTGEPMTAEERAKAETDARLAALGIKLNQDAAEPGAEEKVAEDDPEREKRYEDAMTALLAEFKKRMPPLPTLVGKKDNQVNQLMLKAEREIVAGKFLDAEQTYRQALGWSPGYPLARIGLVHAQIGAGMIRSAELNLRAALSENPILIAVQYQASLLPNPDRLRWVRSQLDNMMQGDPGSRPLVLLAYLGYQSNEPELTRYALDMAQADKPRDPLILLLRRMWLPTAMGGQSPNLPGEPRK